MADAVADQKLDFDRLADDILEEGLAKVLGDKIAEVLAKMFEEEPPDLGLIMRENGELALWLGIPALGPGSWSSPLRQELKEWVDMHRMGEGDDALIADEDKEFIRKMANALRAEADWMESQIKGRAG